MHELPDRSKRGDESICPGLCCRPIRGGRTRPLEPRIGIDVGRKSPDQVEALLQPLRLRHLAACYMTLWAKRTAIIIIIIIIG